MLQLSAVLLKGVLTPTQLCLDFSYVNNFSLIMSKILRDKYMSNAFKDNFNVSVRIGITNQL